MKAIWKRELQGYFYTPVGYVFMGVFLTVSSVLFFMEILRQRSGDLPAFIGEMSYLWMLLSPILTMRLIAEERQKGTDQLLLTSPVSTGGIVGGKALAAGTVLMATTALTGLFVLVVALYGRVYPAELAVNYLGFILQGCAFMAMDLFLSACAPTPAIAAALAFGANFLIWILDLVENAVMVEWIAAALRFMSLYTRNEPFLMGQLSPAGIIFDLSFAAAFLLLTKARLEEGRTRRAGGARLTALMAILLMIGICVGAETLEKRQGWRRDFSFNAIATHSRQTESVLGSLDREVTIYALFRKGDEDAPLMELLDRYRAASPMIRWEQKDPALNPALIARYTTESRTPTADCLIVACEETGRFRILGPEDYVSLSMDPETGEYSYAGWTYERSLTGAIRAVTMDRVPRVVLMQGHGELDGEATKAFVSLLTANQYEVSWADGSGDGLEEGDLAVFFSPLRDLTEEELARMKAFAGKGGSFLFTCDYTDPVADMPNYASLLRSYGFVPREGLTVGDPSEAGTCYNGISIYLMPTMLSTDITIDLTASGADTLLLPGARAFEEPEEGDRNLTVMKVLESGKGAYLKTMTAQSASLDRAEGDPTGPFPLALEARRVTAEGYVSRAFILGCSAVLTEQQIWAMTDAQQFLIRVTEFLQDLKASDLNILARDAMRPGLTPGSTTLGSVILVLLPASVLLAALLVLIPRRRQVLSANALAKRSQNRHPDRKADVN
ncbi:MAG: Gldg family protein [Clostridia bacterium]|nr:Gldg family protein [Clostridia bacterium]